MESRSRSAYRWLLGGTVGALAFVLWSHLVPPSLTAIVSDRLLSATPGAVFGALIDKLQLLGKPLFYVGLVLLQVVGGAALGIVVGILPARSAAQRVVIGLIIGFAAWIVALVAFGTQAHSAGVAAGFLLYGAVAAFAGILLGASGGVAVSLTAGAPAGAPQQRRTFLQLLVGTFGGALALGAGITVMRAVKEIGERASTAVSPGSAGSPAQAPPGLPLPITPNVDFYVISKNFVDPIVDGRDWSLEVAGGFVRHPFKLALADLRALPSATEIVTLECISNDVGGHLMSTARWTGVRLRDLLNHAGLQSGARAIAFRCADDYVESLDMEQALLPTTLVAYEMNGAPLPDKHGFPARIITTGLYGMKNPKWLRSIEPVAAAPTGFWEAQGWSPATPVKTTSRIDVPAPGQLVTGRVKIGGVAFAGSRGIRSVEVSFDDGITWVPARLEPPLAQPTWVLWYLAWPRQLGPGEHAAVVRAVDGTGAIQLADSAPSYPSGATGYHSVTFSI